MQDCSGKAEEKIPLGNVKCRWKENIKVDLQKIRLGPAVHISGSA